MVGCGFLDGFGPSKVTVPVELWHVLVVGRPRWWSPRCLDIAVSFWMFEQVGGWGIAAVVGRMRSRAMSHSAEGKCQALPSMVFRLRVDGCCSVMEV